MPMIWTSEGMIRDTLLHTVNLDRAAIPFSAITPQLLRKWSTGLYVLIHEKCDAEDGLWSIEQDRQYISASKRALEYSVISRPGFVWSIRPYEEVV